MEKLSIDVFTNHIFLKLSTKERMILLAAYPYLSSKVNWKTLYNREKDKKDYKYLFNKLLSSIEHYYRECNYPECDAIWIPRNNIFIEDVYLNCSYFVECYCEQKFCDNHIPIEFLPEYNDFNDGCGYSCPDCRSGESTKWKNT